MYIIVKLQAIQRGNSTRRQVARNFNYRRPSQYERM